MKESRFDELARLFSIGSPRRQMIGAVAVGLAAPLLGLARNEAEAACKKPGRNCLTKKGKKKKCCAGSRCLGKKCKCTGGRKKCGNKCCPKGDICTSGNTCVTGQGSCAAGVDACVEGFPHICNNSFFCGCVQRLQGGTRCVQPTEDSVPDQCATDDDCLDLGYPPGSSCFKDDGFCEGLDPARGMCGAPCGSVPPPDLPLSRRFRR